MSSSVIVFRPEWPYSVIDCNLYQQPVNPRCSQTGLRELLRGPLTYTTDRLKRRVIVNQSGTLSHEIILHYSRTVKSADCFLTGTSNNIDEQSYFVETEQNN